jgi:hypothetical protein
VNVPRLKLLQKAIAETPLDAWQTYQRVILNHRLAPCPALCAYAARLDLQCDFTLIHNGTRGTINRTDGSAKWKLDTYFELPEDAHNHVFGTGGVVPLSDTGPLASDFIVGLLKAHEANMEAALQRVEKTSYEYSDDLTDSLPHTLRADEPLHVQQPTPPPTVRAKVTEFLKPKSKKK